MSNTQAAWQVIRQSRHSPPGRAIKGDRKHVYTAALEQAEQLLRAAGTVGTASKPLLAFYGLSQAARALAAAAPGLDNNSYQLSGHGIRAIDLKDAVSGGIASVRVCNDAPGAFVTVAGVLESSSLPAPTRMGDLWCLLPEGRIVTLPETGSGKCLRIEPTTEGIWMEHHAVVSDLPPELGYDPLSPSREIYKSPNQDTERKRVADYLNGYPSLAGWEFAKGEADPVWNYLGPDGMGLNVKFQGVIGIRAAAEVDRRSIAYENGQRFVFPSTGESHLSVDPFIIWWAVLFTLSMLARYQPKEWMALISVDRSDSAVAVEYILERAVEFLPELIARTIVRAEQLGGG